MSTTHFGLAYAKNKYNAIIKAAKDANKFGYIIDSSIIRIHLYISFIRKYDEELSRLLEIMKQLFAYFELDPAVTQSGKFERTKVKMSKRGSAIGRSCTDTPEHKPFKEW